MAAVVFSVSIVSGPGQPSALGQPSPTTRGDLPFVVRVSHSNDFNGTCEPLTVTVQFHSEITGGSAPFAFAWDFGDGGSSPDREPAHTYTRLANYTVSLRAMDGRGAVAIGSESILPAAPPCAPRVSSFSPYLLAGFIAIAIVGIFVVARFEALRQRGPK